MKRHCAFALFAGVAIIFGTISGAVAVDTFCQWSSEWTPTSAMGSQRAAHSVALLPNGKVLITGGETRQTMSATTINTADLYDPASQTTVPAGSMKEVRELHTSTTLPNGKVLIAGGMQRAPQGSGGHGIASAELYDPATGTFDYTGSMQVARAGHTATLLLSGKVLITGGRASDLFAALDTAEIYDPATGTFTFTAGKMWQVRSEHAAALLNDGRVLIVGGTSGAFGGLISTVEIYYPKTDSPDSNAFLPMATLLTARSNLTATTLTSGEVLVAGGNGPSNYLASTEIYNPASHSFSPGGSMATARAYQTATRLTNGNVLITGGDSSGSLSSTELYDHTAATFSSAGSLSVARNAHTAILLRNGSVLVSGGYHQPSQELYDPLWIGVGPMKDVRSDHTATLLPGGGVLLAGGTSTGSKFTRSAEVFSPRSLAFSLTNPMGAKRSNHTATRLNTGKVLIAGGKHPLGQHDSAELYDQTTASFSPTGSMTSARHSHSATLLDSGKVLIAGGYCSDCADGYAHRTAELYDPATGSFAATGAMKNGRYGHNATKMANGRVLISGGKDDTGAVTNSREIYNPDTGTFTLLASSMRAKRADVTGTLLDTGKVLITGGLTGDLTLRGGCSRSAEICGSRNCRYTNLNHLASPFDTTDQSFMHVKRHAHTATKTNLPGGKVMIIGGQTSYNDFASASVDIYDPVAETFSATESLSSARSGHTATLLRDGRVLVTGGSPPAIGGSAELSKSTICSPIIHDRSCCRSSRYIDYYLSIVPARGLSRIHTVKSHGTRSLCKSEFFTGDSHLLAYITGRGRQFVDNGRANSAF